MNKKDELEQLIDSVLNTKNRRTINTIDAKTYLEKSKKTDSLSTQDISNDSSLSELQSILVKQNAELKEMTQNNFGISDEDFKKFEQQIQADFGCSIEDVKNAEIEYEPIVVLEKFDEIENKLNNEIKGQKDYIHALVNGFKRPFILGTENTKAKSCILVTGDKGTGKHSSINSLVNLLHENKLVKSNKIAWINCRLYQSKEEEILFLQDIYAAIESHAEVLCFSNIEDCFSGVNTYIQDLILEGKIQLSKRYTISKNQLVEQGSGLSTHVISTISLSGQTIIVLTESKKKINSVLPSKVMNQFYDHAQTVSLNQSDLLDVLNSKILMFLDRCQTQLKLEITVDDEFRNYVFESFDRDIGVLSFVEVLDQCFKAIGQFLLENKLNDENITISFDQQPILLFGNEKIYLNEFSKMTDHNDIDSIKAELNEIVGLDEVKKYIYSLQDLLQVQQMRKKQGLKVIEVSKHMIFTGNPGTGKTTIARLVARLFKAMSILSEGQLVEVTRADLVGRYVGHTAPLTNQVIKSALGGVLFIDEAYSLSRTNDDSFGLEAIDTLVKGMEDNRDNLVVILAGYSKEMTDFLKANSGLKSRFANIVDFKDYTGEELYLISESIAKSKDYFIDPNCKMHLIEYFNKIQNESAKTSGNGRLARNLVEQAIINQATRVLKDPTCKLDELFLEDFALND